MAMTSAAQPEPKVCLPTSTVTVVDRTSMKSFVVDLATAVTIPPKSACAGPDYLRIPRNT
jgi:hypothetical protein